MFVEEAKRLALNVGEQPQTQFPQEPFACTIDKYVLATRPDVGKNNHHTESGNRNPESRSVRSSDTGVNAKSNEKRADNCRRCRHRNKPDCSESRSPIRPSKASGTTKYSTRIISRQTVFWVNSGTMPHQFTTASDSPGSRAASTSR